MAGDGRREVFGVVRWLGRLGLDFGFDVGIAGFLLGGCGSIIDGGVLADGAGSDCEEFVKRQDARFAAAVALLAFVEDGQAGCRFG